MYKKKNGVYYTPSGLAEFLAEPLLQGAAQTIFDPAYGDGALLLAAEKILKERSIGNEVNFFGCDTKPVNGLLKHLPQANLLKSDFFNYPIKEKFQTILMNPPYIRHHIQNETKIKKYRLLHEKLRILDKSSDLWALFLVKAISHLNKGGSIGAILPWAFLQADYSVPLRKYLSEKFGAIDVVTLSDKYFEDADERVVVVWLKQYGHKNETIKIASSSNIHPKIEPTKISLNNWLADRVLSNGGADPKTILARYESEYGFAKLSDHADVKIGVVTGAVDHFILSKEEAKEYRIPRHRLIPIITRPAEFPKYILDGKKNLRLLAALKEKDHLKVGKFIRVGIAEGYHLRAHSTLRDPWYAVKVGQVPHAIFHYRIKKTPYLLPNHEGVQCTNNFHRVYFKNLTPTEMKWIYVSMLSSPAQLSLEVNSKTYGRGILKIEPKSLKNAIVIKKNDHKIDPIYAEVMKFLSEDKKEEAMNCATKFINNELQISADLAHTTESLLKSLRMLRLPNEH
jgi:adenine-specific DNA-methyltransferase